MKDDKCVNTKSVVYIRNVFLFPKEALMKILASFIERDVREKIRPIHWS